jgi:zinc protease
MRLTIFLVLFLLIGLQSIAQNSGFDQEKLAKIKNYRSLQLENGLTVICLTTQDTSKFFIRSYTNLPGYVAKNYQALLSVDTELRKNTDFKLPAAWSNPDLRNLQINLAKDEHGFYASCTPESLDTAMYLFSDLFQKPVIEPTKIEMAKRRILSESDSLLKLPTDRIDKITKSIIYGKEHPILKYADVAEINGINLEKYLDFYQRFYKPNNSYLLVMGNISLDSVKTLAQRPFDEWKKKDVPESGYKLIPIEEPKIVFFDTIPTGKTNIKILFPFALHPFTFNSEKAELLSALFIDLLSDKLIKELKLASEIEAGFESDKITGNYQLSVQLEKDSINQVVQAIIATISAITKVQYADEKLNTAKTKIIEDFKKRNTTDEYLSWLIINTESNNLSNTYYANFIEDINSTDKIAMRTFAAKYLNYNTSLFQIPGNWYQSLNDFIELCKNFRIELYELNGNLKKVIPKGFNGFSVINNYVAAVGGKENIKKIKDVSIKFGAIYDLPTEDQLFVEGEIKHKSENRFFTERRMIRPDKDTIFMHQQIFDGSIGQDSTQQGKKRLQGTNLELLKYKSPFVPEMEYQNWQYKAKLVSADTLNGAYVWVVVIDNPAKQHVIDYYDVDKGLRYKRIVTDKAFFNKRTITYGKYMRDEEKGILYPYLKKIEGKNTVIRMLIRDVDYKTRVDRKLFDLE